MDDAAAVAASDLILVGQLVDNGNFSVAHVRNVLKQIWNLAFDFHVKGVPELKSTFLFIFSHG
uniref:Uncharacterized protein n=1 Tax=Manihot esculenta TaxID=3983 RepID=A0A2C9UUE4_MANES